MPDFTFALLVVLYFPQPAFVNFLQEVGAVWPYVALIPKVGLRSRHVLEASQSRARCAEATAGGLEPRLERGRGRVGLLKRGKRNPTCVCVRVVPPFFDTVGCSAKLVSC